MNLDTSANLLPTNIGTIYFTGIGGIGMSGIAEILYNLGYKVKGSDISENANVKRLMNLGIDVNLTQIAQNIDNVAVLVRSSAVKDDNIEVIAARRKNIPVILRAEMLAELMKMKSSVAIAGTHGKTTTTSIVASIFTVSGENPTIINGGILNAYNTNTLLGNGKWLIAEADESDGTFLKLPANIGVITNIDPEHMEHYGTFDNLKNSFKKFIENLPFYGFGVLCLDHPVVASLMQEIKDRKIVSYGISSKQADIRAINIRQGSTNSTFDVNIKRNDRFIKDLVLATPGIHNVLNSLSAIAIALELGFSEENIRNGLKNFMGVQRRFTNVGISNDNITVIDDYGHHPIEIAATLKTARYIQNEKKGKVIAVVQPHRYTRLHSLFQEFCECFSDADIVIVTPIYSAGEKPIANIDHNYLADGIRKLSSKPVYACATDANVPNIVKNVVKNGDMVVCLGAGSITKIAHELPLHLNNL